jgi:hypothetical protein
MLIHVSQNVVDEGSQIQCPMVYCSKKVEGMYLCAHLLDYHYDILAKLNAIFHICQGCGKVFSEAKAFFAHFLMFGGCFLMCHGRNCHWFFKSKDELDGHEAECASAVLCRKRPEPLRYLTTSVTLLRQERGFSIARASHREWARSCSPRGGPSAGAGQEGYRGGLTRGGVGNHNRRDHTMHES